MYLAEDSLNLAVGDFIIWQGDEFSMPDGSTIVSLGMKGKVISLHEGGLEGGTMPARALVEFESGKRLLVDQRMKWEKVSEG